MALIKCVDCGKEVSDRAKICPNCGCPIECSLEASHADQQEEILMDSTEQKENHIPFVADETPEETETSVKQAVQMPTVIPDHTENTNTSSYQPITDDEDDNGGKILKISVAVAVVVLVGLLILGVTFFARNNKNPSDATRTTLPTTQSTTKPKVASSSDNTINYISSRDVQYDDIRQRHELFFGFMNADEEYITAGGGTVTVKIVNMAGEMVYSNTLNFTSADFGSWSNPSWDSSRTLACIYINNTDITIGSSDRGILTMSAVADGASFDDYEIKIYNLPSNGTYTSHYHSYSSTVTTEATCLTDGVRTYTCSCGDSYTKPEPKRTSHSFKPATCTEPKTCKWCGVTEGEPRGHSYNTRGICYTCNGSDPAKDATLSQCSLSLPAVPQVVTYRKSNGEIRSSVYVTALSYEFDYSSGGGVSLKVKFSGTKTFDERGDGQSDACRIGWKLYDSKGNVYETGTFVSPHVANGESFAEQEATLLYGYKDHKPDAYRLELLDVNL